jgi:membrane protein
MLAFIPFSIAIASISAWLPISPRIVDEVEHFFFNEFIPQSGNQIYHLFLLSFKHSTRLSVVGILSLLVTSYGMMFAIEQHINLLWLITKRRSFFHSILIYTGFFVFGPIIVYSLAYAIDAIDNLISEPLYIKFIGLTAAHLITLISFIAIYKFVPNKAVAWRHALYAGIIAALIFILLQSTFNLSMVHLQQQYSLLYGSLAVLPIFLLWLYFSVWILLIGAQTIYVFELQFSDAR